MGNMALFPKDAESIPKQEHRERLVRERYHLFSFFTLLRYCWRSAREARVRNMRYWGEEAVNTTRREQMSLHPQAILAIPEETARVAHAVLPHGNVSMQMRDEWGTLYQDQDFLYLFPTHGQPAQEPW
jgi:hypothetical protein